MKDQQVSTFNQGLSLLSYREHSIKELSHKLKNKGHSESDIASTIERLQEMNYLNDERFSEIFVRSKINKPLGMNRILQELIQKGVNATLAKETINNAEVDWFELAKNLKIRKFGENTTIDFKEKSKQSRYLQYRGFNFDEIQYATSAKEEN